MQSNLAETSPPPAEPWPPEKKVDAYLELADQAKASADRFKDQWLHMIALERKYSLAAFRLIREQRGSPVKGRAQEVGAAGSAA